MIGDGDRDDYAVVVADDILRGKVEGKPEPEA
jgi:hypothetical protein